MVSVRNNIRLGLGNPIRNRLSIVLLKGRRDTWAQRWYENNQAKQARAHAWNEIYCLVSRDVDSIRSRIIL